MSTKARGPAKKPVPQKATKLAPSPTKKTSKSKGIVGTVIDTAASVITGSSTSKKGNKGEGTGKKKSAKQLLRKAYERRAKHQIRMGNLGQARRTLRKKATVV